MSSSRDPSGAMAKWKAGERFSSVGRTIIFSEALLRAHALVLAGARKMHRGQAGAVGTLERGKTNAFIFSSVTDLKARPLGNSWEFAKTKGAQYIFVSQAKYGRPRNPKVFTNCQET